MIRISLFLFLYITFGHPILFAQTGAKDSLLAVLENKAERLSSRINAATALGKHYTYSDTDSAIHFYKKAIEMGETHELDSLLIDSYRLIGRSYYIKGDYMLAYSNVSKGLVLAEQAEDSVRMAKSLNSLGTITFMLNEKQKAISQHRESIRIFESLKDTANLCNNFLNLSIVYQSNEKLDSALYFIQKTLAYTKSIGNKSFLPISYGRYGEILFELKKYREAEQAFAAGLDNDEINDWDKGFNLAGLAQVKYKLGEYKAAIDYGEKGIKYSLKVSSFWDLQRAYKVLANSQEELGNYKQANSYNKLFKVYSDSLFNVEKERDMRFLLFKEEELKNALLTQENLATKSQLHLKTIQLVVLASAMAIFLLLFILVLANRKSKQKLLLQLKKSNKDIAKKKEVIKRRNVELERLHETKDKIFSIIGHDMKSPIASLQTILDLSADGDISEEELKEVMKSLSVTVSALQEMLNNLLHWAKNNLNDISAAPSPIQISELISKELNSWSTGAKAKGIHLLHQKDDGIIGFIDPNHLSIIIRNLIGNAIKFTNKGGNVVVSYKESDDLVEITVKDDGVGMPEEKLNKLFKVFGKEISNYGTQNESGTGIGLSLVHEFVRLNHGSIKVGSELGKGTAITIVFPAYKNIN